MLHNYYSQENIDDRRHTKYALVIYLPDELDRIIAPLRERFDPIYNLVASHITIVFPFDSDLSLDELAGLLNNELHRERYIAIQLSSIIDFYPKAPIICWKVKSNERLNSLYYRLYARLGMPIPYKDYQPHVTVAREISNHRVLLVKEKIVPYLSDEKFEVKAVDLITPLTGNKWVSVRTFPLVEGD